MLNVGWGSNKKAIFLISFCTKVCLEIYALLIWICN